MDIVDIIKESFIFPSKNLEKLAVYIVLTLVVAFFVIGIFVASAIALFNNHFPVVAVIFFIIALLVAFIIEGYQVGIIKSGIEKNEEAPSFDMKNDFITGIKLFIVHVVYFIVPAVIVLIVALIVNVPGTLWNVFQKATVNFANVTANGNSTNVVMNVVPQSAWAALATSIAITLIVAIIVFIIFAFIALMAESRLANTGSLGEALNIPEAFRDITRIGAGKVIAVTILVIVVILVINAILGFIYGRISILSILSVITTPYLIFFAQRATGLLYSDIA